MKKVNDLTVYEENDPCALDEYSKQLADEVHKKIEDAKTEQEIKIDTLETDNTKNRADIETNKIEIEELKLKNSKLQEENNHLINQIPTRKFQR